MLLVVTVIVMGGTDEEEDSNSTSSNGYSCLDPDNVPQTQESQANEETDNKQGKFLAVHLIMYVMYFA